jgi:nucleolar complex protein 3
VFVTYFRILKQCVASLGDPEESDPEKLKALLTPVLEGLSKFAHMINIEFFDDLISILYQLIRSGHLDNNQTLNCLHTVFTILSGEGLALNIDPQRFYAQLYGSFLGMDTETEPEDFPLIQGCVDAMIVKRRKQISLSRVLAFAKRSGTVALQGSPAAASLMLSSLRIMIQNHGQCDILLDTENYGSGVFLPEVEDPEYSNSNATRLWELHLLRRHVHQLTRNFATHVVNGLKGNEVRMDLMKRAPIQVFRAVQSLEEEGDFDLPEEGPRVGKKTRFHGYIYSSKSLTSRASRLIEDQTED